MKKFVATALAATVLTFLGAGPAFAGNKFCKVGTNGQLHCKYR